MKVTQVYQLLNNAFSEVTGQTDLVAEDLTNVVDIGERVFTNQELLDKYVASLINHIGKVVFVDRPYEGQAPSVLMDGWEYGSILEKISVGLPESKVNETWGGAGQGLVNGAEYNPNIFHAPPTPRVKFFNQMDTYAIDMSFGRKQVRQSFSSATQLNAFFSMLEGKVAMRRTIDYDNLIARTINNMIAGTIYNAYGTDDESTLAGSSKARAVNLLYLYKQINTTSTVTAQNCLYDLGFIKFAAYTMALYSDRLEKASTLFNCGGQVRFTPKKLQKFIMLSEFKKAADVYLQSDTFHNEFTKLPAAESVTYWQGSGQTYGFSQTSGIHINTKNPDNDNTAIEVATSGILGCLFDRDALGVNNVENRVYSKFNEVGEFYTNFYKNDARYFNDYDENFIVFFVA